MAISAISPVSSGGGAVYALSPFLNPPYTDPILAGLPQTSPTATVAATAQLAGSSVSAVAPTPAPSAQQQLDATNNSRDFGLYGDSGLVVQSYAAIAQIAAVAQISGASAAAQQVANATPLVTPAAPVDAIAPTRVNASA